MHQVMHHLHHFHQPYVCFSWAVTLFSLSFLPNFIELFLCVFLNFFEFFDEVYESSFKFCVLEFILQSLIGAHLCRIGRFHFCRTGRFLREDTGLIFHIAGIFVMRPEYVDFFC